MDEPSGTGLPLRLYLIQDDIYHYRTGRLSNGNQVLMLSDGDEPPAAMFPWVEFDADGNLLAAHGEGTPQAYPVPLLFTPGTISVKSFFVRELWFGIQDLPDHYQEFLDHPENADDEERRYYPEEIDAWRECQNFVLWCNEDYYLNKDGELESS